MAMVVFLFLDSLIFKFPIFLEQVCSFNFFFVVVLFEILCKCFYHFCDQLQFIAHEVCEAINPLFLHSAVQLSMSNVL